MGNQILRDYTVDDHPMANGGPHFLWKIYNGVHKTTREEVSVFICNIRDIEQKFGAKNVESVVSRFRHESQILSKLRHPLILQPRQPLLETKSEIVMVTEPVLGSVSNIVLKQHPGIDATPKKIEIFDFEVKYGMCQIIEALAFCHRNAKVTHANLTPQNIYITPNGHWKLSGFHFSLYPASSGNNVADPNFVPIPKQISNTHFIPFLDYVAPEYALDSIPVNESDVFSFCLVYAQLLLAIHQQNIAIHGKKKNDDTCHSSILSTFQSRESYITQLNSLQKILDEKLAFLYNETNAAAIMIENIKRGTISNYKERSTSQFILNNCELMFGEEIKAIRFLANLNLREPVKKASFLQTLLPLLKQKRSSIAEERHPPSTNSIIDEDIEDADDWLIPDRIISKRVLPTLLKECTDKNMAIFAVPGVLALGTRMKQEEFSQLVLPILHKHCMVLPQSEKDTNPKIPQIILKYLNVLWLKTTTSEQKNCIIPFLVQSLQYHNNIEIQVEALKRSDEALNTNWIDSQVFTSILLPTIRDTCERTNNEIVRTNAVVCLGKALDHLDSTTIINYVLPMVENALIKNPKYASASLLMSCVGVFRKMTKLLIAKATDGNSVNLITSAQLLHVIAGRILPASMPVASQKALNQNQFTKYMDAIRFMLDKVEEIRLKEFDATSDLQAPLLPGNNTLSQLDNHDEEDLTASETKTEDVFTDSSTIKDTLPSTRTLNRSEAVPNKLLVVSAPQEPNEASAAARPRSNIIQLPANANNPILALLNEVPTSDQKSSNIFFQSGDEELIGPADDHDDSDKRDKEMERLAMLIDRVEQNIEFDNLLNRVVNVPIPDISPLNLEDDQDYASTSKFVEAQKPVNPQTEDTLYPKSTLQTAAPQLVSPRSQETQPIAEAKKPEIDDHFDRLLNRIGDNEDQNETDYFAMYNITDNNLPKQENTYKMYDISKLSLDDNDNSLWNSSPSTARPLKAQLGNGNELDFDSLLNQHIDED
jgi:SCY1-like protein 2